MLCEIYWSISAKKEDINKGTGLNKEKSSRMRMVES